MQGNLTFHVFCDAVKIAYAACVFLRCESENSTTCQLIQADAGLLNEVSVHSRLELIHAVSELDYPRVQRVKQALRKRFRTEYLGHLRQSSKFDKNQKPLQIGDIVLVSSDNTKRIEWPLAKLWNSIRPRWKYQTGKVKEMKSGGYTPVLRLIPLEMTQKVDLSKPPVDRIFPSE
ncbi:hypothetical protein TNIN_14451 [Trichonephila inaurata madagascariensis]|uniref:DUF5641 domain-containing protein n=1 Tax=Trichonephila inaurata madagascariensis TaxID=2747483 RepID=A0A8X6YGM7_9ARAC|nr:hypothetical protein TNIN_14451 [Trichonephila inaurata madagascariensis]